MKRVGLAVAAGMCGLMLAVPAVAQDSTEAEAQKILAQARQAAGGEAKLKAVQSLSYNGKTKRMVRMMMGRGGGEGAQPPAPTMQENDFEVDILAPDKVVRRDTREVNNGAATIISHLGFNGDQPIQRMETIGDLPFQPNFGAPQGDPAPRVRRAKQEFLRNWLGMMLEPAAAYGLSYTSAGSETVNGASYDVVDVAGPDNFHAKLFFDTASHRLTMLRYRAAGGQQMMRMGGGPPPGQGPAGGPPPGEGGQQQQVLQRGPSQEVENEVVFSDFKAVDGITLPFKMRRTVNGELTEETEIKKYKVNSNPKADKFKSTD